MNYTVLLSGEHNHNPPDFNDFAIEGMKKEDCDVELRLSVMWREKKGVYDSVPKEMPEDLDTKKFKECDLIQACSIKT